MSDECYDCVQFEVDQIKGTIKGRNFKNFDVRIPPFLPKAFAMLKNFD
jgi:hypothetical protein